jgi:tetratricopeptide (TPR) repeat protein
MRDISNNPLKESLFNLRELYEAAELAAPTYREIVTRIVAGLSTLYDKEMNDVLVNLVDLKGKARAKEKAEDDYAKRKPGPGLSWLHDIVRGSVEFGSASQVIKFLDLLQNDESIHIVKSKNRFHEPSLTGYRDINIQFQIDTRKGFKHICEIQIHHKEIKKLDKELKSHDYYEYFRSYFAGATSSLKERLEVLKLISHGGAIDDAFLRELLETSGDEERLERLGVLFRDQLCEYHWALQVYGKLFEIHVRKNGVRHPKVANTLSDIALVLKEQGKLDEAMELYTASLEICKERFWRRAFVGCQRVHQYGFSPRGARQARWCNGFVCQIITD